MIPKKILFVIPSMCRGGAETVFARLLNRLDRKRFIPSLCLCRPEGRLLDTLADDVDVTVVGDGKISKYINLFFAIRRKKPDVVISTLGLNLYLAFLSLFFHGKCRFIGRETKLPSLRIGAYRHPWLVRPMFRVLFPRLDTIVCQSRDMKDDMLRTLPVDEKRIVLIHNPVDMREVRQMAKRGGNPYDEVKFNAVAVGRLADQKGIDLLLRAMGHVESDLVHLTIVGDGNRRERLLLLVEELGIQERVTFLGFKDNPYPYMNYADLLVLPSRYEGFPNVVVEAMACGTQVLSFDIKGGINELVRDGKTGWVVPAFDVTAMARKIMELSVSPPLSEEDIRAYVESCFSHDLVLERYSEIFEQ